MPLDPDTCSLFEEDFDPATFQRGLAYANQGKAIIDGVHETASGALEIRGRCHGSHKQLYDVTVWLDTFDDHGTPYVADSTCSCPVGIDCKHAVALLLTFAEQASHLDPRADSGDGNDIRSSTRQWLELLDAPAANADADTLRTPRLVYLLHPERPARLSVGKSQPLKKGGMSKPARYTLHPQDLSPNTRRDFVADADTTPLRLIHAANAGNYYHGADTSAPLVGETGALLLMAAARSGRLYLAANLQQALQAEPARALAMKWAFNEQGLQQLAFDLPPHVYLLPTWPPHFFDPATHSVGPLHPALPEALFRKLMLAPPLNEAEAALVNARLEDYGRRHALELPRPVTALQAHTPAAPPAARLRLGMGRFRHEALFSLEEEYPIAELQFDYGDGIVVSGTEHPDPLIHHNDGSAPRILRRDTVAERAAWQALQDAGLESYRRRMPQYLRLDAAHDCLLTAPADARGWLPLLGEGLARLQAAGIGIEYADNFPFQVAQADDWFVEVDEQDGHDWFDLDLGVVVDGQRVSLVPPLLNLMKEQPQLLSRLETLGEGDTLPVRLDGRRILPVPAPRLRSWLRPLLEFLDDDRPRLSRYHAAALVDLDDLPTQWLGGAALRELGQRLRNFSGIAEAPPAPGFAATLRPYQQAGLNWLQFLRSYGLSGILADDMGLGKTVQTLAHLHLEKTSGRADRPSLVVAPTSLLPNWAAEARQFAPALKVLTLHGPARDQHFETMDEADLILTTYALLVRDRERLLACDYHLLVLDEAQFIKNPKAQSHQVARKLRARHRLSLTGTPLENHLGELWAQFDFLMPGLLGEQRRFAELFRTPIEKQGDTRAHRRLSARVAPFLLRRTKEQVLSELPPRTEIVRWVELGGGQRDLYESLRVAFDKKLREALASQGVGRSQIMILDALLKLRQACCDPRLVKLESARRLGARGIEESAKLAELMELLEELVDEGRRILLFSQFTSMLGLIEAELKKRGLKHVKLTGQTVDRESPVRSFQSGKVPIFMISLKAGGTGLNLTAADTVIHYDPWWNPAVEAQATARAHRIGQDKPVFVYKLLGRGTVEEKILALQERKRGLSDQLMGGRQDGEGGHLITAEDLEVLFQPLG